MDLVAIKGEEEGGWTYAMGIIIEVTLLQQQTNKTLHLLSVFFSIISNTRYYGGYSTGWVMKIELFSSVEEMGCFVLS
jgi:hypothetical protein